VQTRHRYSGRFRECEGGGFLHPSATDPAEVGFRQAGEGLPEVWINSGDNWQSLLSSGFLRLLDRFPLDGGQILGEFIKNIDNILSKSIMSQGKQAKVLTTKQVEVVLDHVSRTRHPERKRVFVLLSTKAGLRAKEISALTWAMVTDADGRVADAIHLTDTASKGKGGGRTIPLNPLLRDALEVLHVKVQPRPAQHVAASERGHYTAGTMATWFYDLFKTLGLHGASSHSGRRTFITNAARKISQVGGSLRDVQQLAGHSSLATTQRYIEGDTDAKRKLISLL
jgi:integrase/recombinase XerC